MREVSLETGKTIAGRFPPRAERLVLEWHALHKNELVEDWRLAGQRKPLNKIEPLE